MRSPKSKDPYIPFYTGDWLRDVAVRVVSNAARGLWIDLLCHMHNSPDRGYLRHKNGNPMTVEQIARLTGNSLDVASSLLDELIEAGTCSVADDNAVYCRRMAFEAQKSEVRAKAGAKGGRNSSKTRSKTQANNKAKPEQKAALSESVSESYSEYKREGRVDDHPPSPTHPHSRSGNGTKPSRDPASPPDWSDPDEWAQACRLADLIENADSAQPTSGRGGIERAVSLAMMLQDAGKPNVLKITADKCVQTIELLTCDSRFNHCEIFSEILAKLRKYPDGAYPNTSTKTTTDAGPSRIEQAWRIIQKSGGLNDG